MKISELPEELRQLVKENQVAQGNDGSFVGLLDNDKYANNFTYGFSPQGYDFWNRVRNGEDMRDHPAYPKKKEIQTFKFC